MINISEFVKIRKQSKLLYSGVTLLNSPLTEVERKMVFYTKGNAFFKMEVHTQTN